MTITLDAETVEVEWTPADVTLAIGTGTGGSGWSARIVDRFGALVAVLDKVRLAPVNRRINQEATAGFVLSRGLVDEYDAIDLVASELQVYRGESLRFFGPIYTDQGTATDKGEVPFGAAGFWSLFRRRLRGGWQPWSNRILNPRFDDGLDRWLTTGDVSLDSEHETGTQSALLEGADASVAQFFQVALEAKYQLVVAARVKVGVLASPGRGLEVAVPGVQGGDKFRADPVTASTPRGTWTSLTAVLNVEGRVGARSVTVAVFGADGDDVLVDRVEATIYPLTSISDSTPPTVEPGMEDMGTVVSELIQASNTGLNVGVDSPVTGVQVANTPDEWIDKTTDEVMRIFTGREDGLEFAEVWTPTSRTIRTFYPRQGVDWDPEVLTLSCPGNLTKLERTRNAVDAVSEVTMVGDGGARGVARDETAFGGVLLQKVERAPTGVPLSDLEGRARKALKASIDAVTTLKGTMTMADFVASGLDMGDRVQVEADALALQVGQVCRVVAIEEDPNTDLATLLLNPEPESGS